MYIQVRLLNGYQQYLWYRIPQTVSNHDCITSLIGRLVKVPIRRTQASALIIAADEQKPSIDAPIRDIIAFEQFPDDETYTAFIARLAHHYRLEPIFFLKRLQNFLRQNTEIQLPSKGWRAQEDKKMAALTAEQQAVVDFLTSRIVTPVYTPTVLHGVTGSGKTEVYKALILCAFEQGKSTILLLPEVTLAHAFEQRLRSALPHSMTIFGFHSGATSSQKKIAWQHIMNKQPALIIGVHLPILLPLANLGLVIVDEEHDVGFQEKQYPKINSREAAIMRAHSTNIPIVLGSATPSISTLYNVNARDWHYFRLKKRFRGAFARMHVVPLGTKKERAHFWISPELQRAIQDRLFKKEQVIIFINRRGFSFFVQCTLCSFVFSCDACSVSLTLHHGNTLICHYCGHQEMLKNSCPSCSTDERNLLKRGIGTQQIVTILEKLFPAAHVARADRDISAKKKMWQSTIDAFSAGTIDILVGTQTITKGYDFPNVTLVGIIWADSNLNFPFYNATETTLQQLIQVAGRAGRACAESLVIVQTIREHDIFRFCSEEHYLRLYAHEMRSRSLLKYPPAERLAHIELKHSSEEIVQRDADAITAMLCAQAALLGIIILGPTRPLVHKIAHVHIRLVYLKAQSPAAIHRLLDLVDFKVYQSAIAFVQNPLS